MMFMFGLTLLNAGLASANVAVFAANGNTFNLACGVFAFCGFLMALFEVHR